MTEILKKTYNFFQSVRTTIWLLFAVLILLSYGAVAMPVQKEHQALHDLNLFAWMVEYPVSVTWWLWAAITVLALLAVNTFLCSFESVIRKCEAKQWLLIISPQVIHIGFLFILLAHLLSSYGGFRGTAFASRESVFQLPNGLEVVFNDVRAAVSPDGYIRDWSAHVSYFKEGNYIASDVIKPNSPSFRDGLGMYVKEIRVAPFPVALIEVSREPGAVWALLGGILFIAGMTILLALRIKREDKTGT